MSETDTAKNPNNKRILRIVAYALVIVAVIVVVLLVWNSQRSSASVEDETSTDSEVIDDVADDNNTTTAAEQTTSRSSGETTTSSSGSTASSSSGTTASSSTSGITSSTDANETVEIDAFMSGSYYMVFTTSSDSSESPVEFAISGSDFQMSMDMDGMAMSALYLDGQFYIINPDNSTYISMSETLMSTMGLDTSSFSEVTEAFDMSDIDFTSVERNVVSVDGEDMICYTYSASDVKMNFYLDGTDLVQIEFCDSAGNVTETVDLDDFSATIPDNMLTVSGYTKSNLLSFFMDMAS